MSVFDDANLPKSRLYRTAYVVGSLLVAGALLVGCQGAIVLAWAARP